jgi:predicted permease
MINSILASLVPVFLVMILGFVAGLTKDVDNRNIGSLNAMVMDFALPAALFTAPWRRPRGKLWRVRPAWLSSCCWRWWSSMRSRLQSK